jgi:hypothetical protein
MNKIEYKTMDPWKVEEAEYNPRKKLRPGSKLYESLRNSLTEFGLVEPLVWNKRSMKQGWPKGEKGVLVGGHQRLRIIRELGWPEVPLSVVDLDEIHEKALNVALNKTDGAWESGGLAKILAEIDESPLPVRITGFDGAELDRILDGSREEEPEWIYTPELLEEHNFLVLYFDSEVDWQSAKDVFGIGTVHALDSRPGYERKGIGRLVPGAEVVRRILKGEGRS